MFSRTAQPGPFASLATIFRTADQTPAKPSDTSRARRDFMLAKMDETPNAFGSELDVQCMMHCYPGRF